MLIDTHAHVNFNAFRDDADQVIKRTLAQDTWLINVGSQFETSERTVEFAQKYPTKVFAAVGLHPSHLEEGIVDEGEVHFRSRKEEFDIAAYRLLAQRPKVVAIGEFGLDYYRLSDGESQIKTKKSKQLAVFKEQLGLARELNLPAILHCRGSKENPADAYLELLETLKQATAAFAGRASDKLRGVIHCFGSTLDIARKFIDLGFYIGFTGIITFPKTDKLKEVVGGIPIEKILTETDCPYLTPEPYRGKRNEPLYVEFVARKIAEIKKMDFEAVAKITSQNAKELFNLIKFI